MARQRRGATAAQPGRQGAAVGRSRNNIHANDIDFQIESDFIGLMTPGLPQESNRYCSLVGRIMNHGDGLYGGMFFGGMYSAAFFERDISRWSRRAWRPSRRAAATRGLSATPSRSGEVPTDWRKSWTELEAKWDRDDSCTDGASRPFNIDARLNGAYVALGLLYGGGDFAKTLDITTRFGQDSDCNPSSAAGIVGVMLGYTGIPAIYTSGIPELGDAKFDYTEYSFNAIAHSTLERALKVVVQAGGRVNGDVVEIPAQAAAAPPLEQWDMGVPAARLDPSNKAWTFTGEWTTNPSWDGGGVAERKTSTAQGNAATFTFEGTAVALVGRMAQDGGRADVFSTVPRQGRSTRIFRLAPSTTTSGTGTVCARAPIQFASSPGTMRIRCRRGSGSPSRSASCITHAEDQGVGPV